MADNLYYTRKAKKMSGEWNHFDQEGNAVMVDVSGKEATVRTASATGTIRVNREIMDAILQRTVKKGDVLGVARVAGIMAAKKTSELIPMCHPIPIDSVKVDIEPISETQVRLVSMLRCTHKTGIEMEALTAASVAALTIYDMCKAVDRGMRIDDILLLHKDGGKSGTYQYQPKKIEGAL